ncbi:hypothetical protein [Patulibacter defluvii]|uniref:hypothetical protein n=1 Tax=Patulibacter defluvii TaxID=3095358 RepID=UPI002A74845A|nr:hypothetical protein [Patulibacter sp. DM4]
MATTDAGEATDGKPAVDLVTALQDYKSLRGAYDLHPTAVPYNDQGRVLCGLASGRLVLAAPTERRPVVGMEDVSIESKTAVLEDRDPDRDRVLLWQLFLHDWISPYGITPPGRIAAIRYVEAVDMRTRQTISQIQEHSREVAPPPPPESWR